MLSSTLHNASIFMHLCSVQTAASREPGYIQQQEGVNRATVVTQGPAEVRPLTLAAGAVLPPGSRTAARAREASAAASTKARY